MHAGINSMNVCVQALTSKECAHRCATHNWKVESFKRIPIHSGKVLHQKKLRDAHLHRDLLTILTEISFFTVSRNYETHSQCVFSYLYSCPLPARYPSFPSLHKAAPIQAMMKTLPLEHLSINKTFFLHMLSASLRGASYSHSPLFSHYSHRRGIPPDETSRFWSTFRVHPTFCSTS